MAMVKTGLYDRLYKIRALGALLGNQEGDPIEPEDMTNTGHMIFDLAQESLKILDAKKGPTAAQGGGE